MKKKKRIYLTIIFSSLIIIGFSTYYALGGFEEIEVFVLEGKERTVVGNEYIEKYDYYEFSRRMKETRSAIDAGKLKGMLTLVIFEDETIGKDSIHYFLGASVDEISDVLRLPSGYDYKEFKTDKAFKIFLTQHPLVRPTPNETKELATIKAKEEGKMLLPFSFELYYEDESLSVEFWAK